MKTSKLKFLGLLALIAPLATFAETSSSSAPLNDANIAAIVVAANTIDIKAGKLAEKKSDNAQVKAFAEMMIKDHESVNKQASDLVTKLGVKPMDNDLSKQLKADAEKTYDSLKGKKGADFDQAYINNEVGYHEAVISVVKNTLITNAQNAELKALLQAVLPALEMHLEHAKMAQSHLKS